MASPVGRDLQPDPNSSGFTIRETKDKTTKPDIFIPGFVLLTTQVSKHFVADVQLLGGFIA